MPNLILLNHKTPLVKKLRYVSNSVVYAKSDTTIDTICVDSGIVVLYSI